MNINIVSKSFDELIEDMDIETFPDDEKSKLLSRVSELVLKRVYVEIMEKIGEKGRAECDTFLAGSPSSDETKAFFSDKVGDIDALIEKTVDDLRSEMAEGV